MAILLRTCSPVVSGFRKATDEAYKWQTTDAAHRLSNPWEPKEPDSMRNLLQTVHSPQYHNVDFEATIQCGVALAILGVFLFGEL